MKKKYISQLFSAALCMAVISSSNNTQAQFISTIAGTGVATYSGDGGAATSAAVRYPYHTLADAAGNIYVTDWGNNRIRKIDATGTITTIAGTGVPSLGGDGSAATAAYINQPAGIAISSSGEIYFSDNGNNRIRKINTSGIISTVAGTVIGYSGDGLAATAAKMTDPRGIAFDAAGNLYVAEASNHVIRKIDATGTISTVVGTKVAGYSGEGLAATSSMLNNPKDVAFDASGNLYIADYDNHRIRIVTSAGVMNTCAGNGFGGFIGDGIPATAAEIKYPDGLFVDGVGNIYIGDEGNNRIRKVNPAGNIYTIMGTGAYSSTGDGGPATAATAESPSGISRDAAGNIYFAEGASRIRKVTPTPLTVSGGGSICSGNTTTLTTSLPDGTWTSSNTAIATVGTSGVVTSVSAGTAIISYTESGTTATKTITVVPMPAAITGSGPVCPGNTTTFANTVTGGVWTSSDGTIATVDAAGVVTGIAVGTATITYDISGCNVTNGITVVACTTGVTSVDDTHITVRLYPNPAQEAFTIAVPQGTTAIAITDIFGRNVATVTTQPSLPQTLTISSEKLPAGNYTVKTFTGQLTLINKLAIIK